MRDLLIVDYWNQCNSERLPVTFNNFQQGGYINMPSARMGAEGEIGGGYSSVPPYRIYNLRFQLLKQFELTFNYRIFKGIPDPLMGRCGFGDFSDKGANFKFSLFSPEDSHYALPGVSIGCDDFLGTRAFKAQYIVLTQVLLKYNMEFSLGYGRQRIKGFFGGISWFPFRKSPNPYLQELSFTTEYDGTDYKNKHVEPHPDGRFSKTPWNFGFKYRLWDLDFSLAWVRGSEMAFSASGFFNFGHTKGIIPKIDDSLPYKSPVNLEEIGPLRPEDVLVQDLIYAFRDQGMEIIEAWFSYECDEKVLRLLIMNNIYREEKCVRERLNCLLSSLIPSDIDCVIVTIETDDLPVQEYHYHTAFLQAYLAKEIGRHELNILTPLREASLPNPYVSKLIFKKRKELWNIELMPKTIFLFGSSKGKLKYALGLTLALNGFLFDDLFYSFKFGYFFFSNLHDISDIDWVNPSQLVNVRTDVINYLKQKSISVDEAYVQKMMNMGNGWYARSAIGLFEIEYGGVAGEVLYYPVNSDWAVGVDAAIVKKRTYTGVGFTNRARILKGFKPHHVKFLGTQYFLTAYYDCKDISMDFKVSAGKFLAFDYGTRFEVSRYYPSGFRISFWYTYTSAHDIVNCHRYQDKGIAFSMPLDIFYTKSSRSRWGYGMSAWLRDVGVRAFTGPQLYDIINDQRQ